MGEFRSANLGLVAYLAVGGHGWRAAVERGRVVFSFTSTTAADTLAYKSGGSVPARAYYGEMRRARSMIWWLTKDRVQKG